MNKRLNRLERKYGKYAIRNLTLYIIIGYVAGYVLEQFAPEVLDFLRLDPYQIMHGQIWRVFTWILTPPAELGIFTLIMLFFYYSIGNELERSWGAFRYNIYLLSGMLFSVAGAFIAYFYVIWSGVGEFGIQEFNLIIGERVGLMFSTYYITTSILFAYALYNPGEQVLLYGIIPIKMKWIALLYGAFILFDFINNSGIPYRISIISSLLNFIVFYFMTRKSYKTAPKRLKRKYDFNKKVRQAAPEGGTLHKCTVCGRTEKDSYDLEFRYCSKCKGNHEYCQDHLFTHEHIK